MRFTISHFFKAMADLTLKLSIRGAAAAPKTSQIQVALSITNTSGRTVTGSVEWTLKDVISNDIIKAKTPTASVTIPASGYSQNFNLGDFYDTPRTGAYLVTATMNGSSSNNLPIKILL